MSLLGKRDGHDTATKYNCVNDGILHKVLRVTSGIGMLIKWERNYLLHIGLPDPNIEKPDTGLY